MKAKRAAEIAEAKRLAELRLKNPETQAWNKYKEKKETLVARGNTNFIEVCGYAQAHVSYTSAVHFILF